MNRGTDLMDGHSVLVVHFVELIDEAHSFVGQHQGSALESPFFCDCILLDCCGQTHSTCALSCVVTHKCQSCARLEMPGKLLDC